jgi:hypothetical protein
VLPFLLPFLLPFPLPCDPFPPKSTTTTTPPTDARLTSADASDDDLDDLDPDVSVADWLGTTQHSTAQHSMAQHGMSSDGRLQPANTSAELLPPLSSVCCLLILSACTSL